MTLVAHDKTGYWTKTAGKNSNTEEEILAEFQKGKTKFGSRAVALFKNVTEAQLFLRAAEFLPIK